MTWGGNVGIGFSRFLELLTEFIPNIARDNYNPDFEYERTKTVHKFNLKISLIFLVFIHTTGNSGELEVLLNQRLRPTVSQVKDLMDKGIEFSHPGGNVPLRNDFDSVPEIIALLEWYYPGATWAPLGRDAFFLGDILEAFYLSIGQGGRVSRLNCSTESFGGANHTMLYEFLKNAGLDLEHINTSPPFIIFDNTSYGGQSQSTRLIAAGYNAYRERGGSPKDLIRKFNLWTTHSRYGANSNGTNPKDFFDSLLLKTGSRPAEILRINIAYPFTYGSEWHNPFGLFSKGSNGKVMATPGDLKGLSERKAILFELSQLIQTVYHPSFLEKVRERAHHLGYEFSTERLFEFKEMPKLSPREVAEIFKDNLEKKIFGFSKDPEQKGYLSRNGFTLKEWLESTSNSEHKNSLLLLFIEKVTLARVENKITDKDFRRLLARVFGKLTIPDDEFFTRFIELYITMPLLQEVLSRKRDVFVESRQSDKEDVKRAYLYLENEMENRCTMRLLKEKENNLTSKKNTSEAV